MDWVNHADFYEKLIYFVSDSQTKIATTAILFVRNLEGFNVIADTINQRSMKRDWDLPPNSQNRWLAIGSGLLPHGSVDQDKNAGDKRNYGIKDTSKDSQSTRCGCGRRQIQCVTIKSSQSDWLKPWGLRIVGYCIPLNIRRLVEPTKSKSLTCLVLSSTGVSRSPSGTVWKSNARKVVGASNW